MIHDLASRTTTYNDNYNDNYNDSNDDEQLLHNQTEAETMNPFQHGVTI